MTLASGFAALMQAYYKTLASLADLAGEEKLTVDSLLLTQDGHCFEVIGLGEEIDEAGGGQSVGA